MQFICKKKKDKNNTANVLPWQGYDLQSFCWLLCNASGILEARFTCILAILINVCIQLKIRCKQQGITYFILWMKLINKWHCLSVLELLSEKMYRIFSSCLVPKSGYWCCHCLLPASSRKYLIFIQYPKVFQLIIKLTFL